MPPEGPWELSGHRGDVEATLGKQLLSRLTEALLEFV